MIAGEKASCTLFPRRGAHYGIFSDFCRVTKWRAMWIFLEEKSTKQWWLCSIPIREMLQKAGNAHSLKPLGTTAFADFADNDRCEIYQGNTDQDE
jgi:hypothetical protein